MKKTTLLAPIAALGLALTSLTGSFTSASAASTACTPSALKTVTAKTLTIATGAPAYSPWVIDDKPESGKGFEAAVAYAVAKKLGYTNAQVKDQRSSTSISSSTQSQQIGQRLSISHLLTTSPIKQLLPTRAASLMA